MSIKETKKSYQARKDNKGKPINNVANYGLKKNGVAIRANDGEYSGFTIQVLEEVKPLLVDFRVANAMNKLSENNIQGAISILNLGNDVKNYGIGIIYEILRIWLEKNELFVLEEYKTKAIKITDKNLNKWILHKRSEPLLISFKILSVGKSKKGNPVVPESWLNRTFKNGYELHSEMDKLDWRKGKPPVHFCCIHSMTIKKIESWSNDLTSSTIKEFESEIGIYLDFDNFDNNNSFKTIIKDLADKKQYNNFISEIKAKKEVWVLPYTTKNLKKILIACDIKKLSNENPKYEKTDNIGILVSRLQKSIRRGRWACKILKDTIVKLSKSPPYNIPDQQFIRVSGARQLTWRLFITIIEDASPYLEDQEQKYFSMLDILCLALIAQADPNVQFNQSIIEKLVYTALLVQFKDQIGSIWDWRKGKVTNELPNISNDTNLNSFVLSLRYMPMMSNDKRMIKRGIDFWNKCCSKLNASIPLDTLLKFHNKDVYRQTKKASYDNHCMPNMIIFLQAGLPFVPTDKSKHGTKALSSFMWEHSSRFNVRYDKNIGKKLNLEKRLILKSLRELQSYISNNNIIDDRTKLDKYVKPNTSLQLLNDTKSIPDIMKRLAFNLIFGEKVRLPALGKDRALEIVVSGTTKEPCKVKRPTQKVTKYLEGKERFEGELRYINYMKKDNKIKIKVPNPPERYEWIWGKQKEVSIWVDVDKLKKSNIIFYANGIKLLPFDGSKLLVKIKNPKPISLDKNYTAFLKQGFYYKTSKKNNYGKVGQWEYNLMCREVSKLRKNNLDRRLFDWLKIAKKSNVPTIVWRCLIVKLYNNYKNEVQIGPVDRRGNKVHESINYLYEGTIMRMFNILSVIYPFCVVPKTSLKFSINKNVEEYGHLLDTLFDLADIKENNNKKHIITNKITIKTKLWDHQKKTSEHMYDNLVNIGRKGCGDASNVGSGKTLTALSVISKIHNYHIDRKKTNTNAYLILVPTTKLFKTWTDEIEKHINGLDVILQNANGSLTKDIIKPNSIVITTLGRARDHPFLRNWNLIVIDECLSVQNKDALQTEEAFRQVVCSKYGVIMMSATFFRSRFDKLYYMLKMLRSGIPEEKRYLDTILTESIICNIPEKSRKWTTTILKYELGVTLRQRYDEIANQNLSSETLYNALSKLLYDKFNYINCFKKTIQKLKQNQRALIYANSKAEADKISQKIPNVSRYPDKSKRHVTVSIAEGAYGLNDLIIYNCIICKPQNSDILHQMRGRIDRPFQKSKILNIYFILAKDTIEEAELIRMEMANNFYKNHIIPLAEFYDLAVKSSRKKTIKISKNLKNKMKVNKINLVD